ncbi:MULTISPECIES: hypothetical protein [Ruegeria]|uniref:Uncharacterized protein n=1 Tax=Ruegeria atlantica TaxID=81569 RepID=A0AA90Z222_9RHOB|nr:MULTISPECIES: hypothetical protein [Ruegeria]NOC45842.1 hypothetical protein [Ruegeria sp. HKCCD7559]NOC84618.1 hypothetical protein [Ruegeria sp. HKCCD6428]NOC93764.1 hypothetical protein [Ruegeria sp. HKCCD6604]NOD31778.1 hypothetical protein [Ruegeria atlantica]NOD96617.1 hypothetical protein [Ruegeria sp. HKCCD6228]
MTKLIAIINVIAWAGFWAFGYIALTSDDLTEGQLTIAAILAFAGLIMGVLAYLKLVRASEASGYAKGSNQLDAEARNRAQEQWGK